MKLRGKNGSSPFEDEVYRNRPRTAPEEDRIHEIEVVPQGAIVPAQDGDDLEASGYLITNTGLQRLAGATFEDWLAMGESLLRLDRKIQFAIGDWFIEGVDVWAMDKAQIAAALDRELHTIENYIWVCRAIPDALRKELLFFGHHALVAKMPDEEKEQWLNAAVERQWSVADLRHEILKASIPTQAASRLANKKYKAALNKVWRVVSKGGLPEPEAVEKVRSWLDAIEAERKKARG